jgi:hypothetical protein
MSNRNSGSRKPFRFDLASARAEKEVPVKGRFLRIVDASDASAAIYISIEETGGGAARRMTKNGKIFEGQGFSRIFITNEAQANKWIEFVISDGEDDYDVENPSLGTIDEIAGKVIIGGGSGRIHGEKTVNTTAVEVLPANADRTSWLVHNNGNVDIFLGSDNTVTAANGMPVPAGGKVGDVDGGAVWAISGTAGQDVRYWEAE